MRGIQRTKLLLALLRVHQEFIIESSRSELRYTNCGVVTRLDKMADTNGNIYLKPYEGFKEELLTK